MTADDGDRERNVQGRDDLRSSVFESNVGGPDRRLRAVLAVVFAAVAAWGAVEGHRTVAVVAGLAAVGTGFNAVFCWCGVNEALGLDTTRSGRSERDREL